MKNLYSANVDQSKVDNLISGTLIPCKVIRGDLSSGTGIIKRGTIVVALEDGTYEACEDGDDIDGILLNDVDLEDQDELVGAQIACGGEFNQNKIEEVMGVEISIQTITSARHKQIFIAPMNPAPEA